MSDKPLRPFTDEEHKLGWDRKKEECYGKQLERPTTNDILEAIRDDRDALRERIAELHEALKSLHKG